MYAYFLYLTSQVWKELTPAPEEELEDCVDFPVYNDEIQELETMITQHLKGTKVATFSGPLYIVVWLCPPLSFTLSAQLLMYSNFLAFSSKQQMS